MPATRPSKSTKSAPVSPKRTSASTGSFRPPPAYGINSVDPASSSSSLAIQPSHGLPAAQKRKGISGLSSGKQEEAFAPAFHIRPAGDAYEQQADRIAENISGQLQNGGQIRRVSEPVKPLRESGRKEGEAASPALASGIAAARGKGRPLSEKIRKPAEKALGRSLGDVRLHTGAQASSLNREVGSAAFAVQKDIFVRDHLDFSKPKSQELALHEAVHTQQQNGNASSAAIQRCWPFCGRTNNQESQGRELGPPQPLEMEPRSPSSTALNVQDASSRTSAPMDVEEPPNQNKPLRALRAPRSQYYGTQTLAPSAGSNHSSQSETTSQYGTWENHASPPPNAQY